MTPQRPSLGPLTQGNPAIFATLGHGLVQTPYTPTSEDWQSASHDFAYSHLAAVALSVMPQRSALSSTRRYLQFVAFEQAAYSRNLLTASIPLLAELLGRGCRFLLIKGPTFAPYHASPHHRTYTDIDIFVARGDYQLAVRTARHHGYLTATPAQPRDWMSRHCLEALSLRSDEGSNIDLHHTLAPWIFGRALSFDTLAADASTTQVGDLSLPSPSAPHLLSISAIHILNNLWRNATSYMAWRDLLAIAVHLGPQASSDALRAADLGWLISPLASALQAVSTHAQVFAPTTRSYRASRRARLHYAGWDSQTRRLSDPLRWALRLPAARALGYVTGSLFPSRQYVAAQHLTYPHYWRRTAAHLFQPERAAAHSVTAGSTEPPFATPAE